MKIIETKKDYINYLKNFDKFVLKPDGKSYKKERKYLGVIFSYNCFDYFIPFSSPDKVDDYDIYQNNSYKKALHKPRKLVKSNFSFLT